MRKFRRSVESFLIAIIVFGSGTLAISNHAVAFGNCSDAEVIEQHMAKITHQACFAGGSYSRECVNDEKLLCEDLKLIQNICHTLTQVEMQHLQEIRNNGITCAVPNH